MEPFDFQLNSDGGEGSFDEETAVEIHKEARAAVNLVDRWFDSADTKITTVFGVAGLVAGVAPAFGGNTPAGPTLVLWGCAIVAWLLCAVFCYLGFKPRTAKVELKPAHVLKDEWVNLPYAWYLLYRARDLDGVYTTNKSQLRKKLNWLNGALIAVTAEISLVGAAIIVGNVS